MVNAAIIRPTSEDGLFKLEVYMDSQVGVSHIVYRKDIRLLAQQLVTIIEEEQSC
jgi:hypothetical protein